MFITFIFRLNLSEEIVTFVDMVHMIDADVDEDHIWIHLQSAE